MMPYFRRIVHLPRGVYPGASDAASAAQDRADAPLSLADRWRIAANRGQRCQL